MKTVLSLALVASIFTSSEALAWNQGPSCQVLPQGTVCASFFATWFNVPDDWNGAPNPSPVVSDVPSPSVVESQYPVTGCCSTLYSTDYDYVDRSNNQETITTVSLSLDWDNSCTIIVDEEVCRSCRHCGDILPGNVSDTYTFDCTNVPYGRKTNQCESGKRIPDGNVDFLFPLTRDAPAVQEPPPSVLVMAFRTLVAWLGDLFCFLVPCSAFW